jgi:hypothetical protein
MEPGRKQFLKGEISLRDGSSDKENHPAMVDRSPGKWIPVGK